MGVAPDPGSVYWERAAAAWLGRVIKARGAWYAGRITDPPAELEAELAAAGYRWDGPDDKSGRGRLNARDRWRRSFVRAVYRANDTRNGGPGRTIEIQVGRKMPGHGVVPPYRPVRGRTRRGGKAAAAAVARMPEADRWAHGGGASSHTERRRWPQA